VATNLYNWNEITKNFNFWSFAYNILCEKNELKRFRFLEIIWTQIWNKGSISQTFYKQILLVQISNGQKDRQVINVFFRFWALNVFKLLVKYWWNWRKTSELCFFCSHINVCSGVYCPLEINWKIHFKYFVDNITNKYLIKSFLLFACSKHHLRFISIFINSFVVLYIIQYGQLQLFKIPNMLSLKFNPMFFGLRKDWFQLKPKHFFEALWQEKQKQKKHGKLSQSWTIQRQSGHLIS